MRTSRNARPGRRVLPVLGLTLALMLSACGQEGASSTSDASEEGSSSPRAGSERLLVAAETGMERAASFGFDAAGFYTEDAMEDFRTQMSDSLQEGEADADIQPASCAEPLIAVDWAPLLLDTEAVRVDFGSETFTGTGSLEIAEVDGAEASERVDEHMDHVATLVESCAEVTMTQMETSYDLTLQGVELEELEPAGDDGQGTSAYSRTRSLAGAEEDGTIAAQILFTRRDDDVVMVSFIGEPAATSAEFTAMAESITDETLEGLED